MAAPKGNKNAVRGRVWRDAIMRCLEKRSRVEQVQAIEALADALINKAFEGDIAALREFGDRVEGKAIQAVEHSGPDGDPVAVSIYLPDNGRSD